MSDATLPSPNNTHRWRIAGWGLAAALLIAPAIAMQFTHQVVWTAIDFATFGAMLLATGAAIELAVHYVRGPTARRIAVVAAVGLFLAVWVLLATGD